MCKRRLFPIILCMTFIFTSFSLEGCSSIRNIQKNKQIKIENAKKKKDLYLALKTAMANNELHKGETIASLKTKYGAPDDIFYSGSSLSSLQVWTYNATKNKLEDSMLNAILLYFENDKLVNWKY